MRKLLYLLLLVVSSANRIMANPDSLRQVIATAKHDTTKAKTLIKLAYSLHLSQPDSSLVWAAQALEFAKKSNHVKSQANAYLIMGLVNASQSRHNDGIKYYQMAMPLYYQVGDLGRVAGMLSNIGLVYTTMANYPKAMEYMLKASGVAEKVGDKQLIATCIGNLGHISYERGDIDAALKYNRKSLSIRQQLKDYPGIAIMYNNIGLIKVKQKEFDEAVFYHTKSLEIKKELQDTYGEIYSLENLGTTYLEKAKFLKQMKLLDAAANYYKQSLKLATDLNEPQGISECYRYLGEIEYLQGNKVTATEYLNKSVELSEKIEYNNLTSDCYKFMIDMFRSTNDFKSAFLAQSKLMKLNDSIINTENNKQIIEMESKYNNEKKSLEIEKLKDEKKFSEQIKENQRKTNIYLSIAVALTALVGVVILIGLINKQKANNIIKEQKKEVEFQKNIIEEKQKEVMDSINYAKRIQYTLLAHEDILKQNLSEHFIYFNPKDIVSGDFYWATKKDNKFYLAVCDSTGHGVPGAFMSLLSISFLNEAIIERNILKPNEVFNYVRKRLEENMSKEGQKDGFDGILLCFETNAENVSITYAAAHNNPVLIKKNQLIELPADKMPVGVGEKNESFALHNIEADKGDTLYLFTDGYADQFGGPKGKKFKYKQLYDLFLLHNSDSLANQRLVLQTTFNEWKGSLEQIDDVCVIGIKM